MRVLAARRQRFQQVAIVQDGNKVATHHSAPKSESSIFCDTLLIPSSNVVCIPSSRAHSPLPPLQASSSQLHLPPSSSQLHLPSTFTPATSAPLSRQTSQQPSVHQNQSTSASAAASMLDGNVSAISDTGSAKGKPQPYVHHFISRLKSVRLPGTSLAGPKTDSCSVFYIVLLVGYTPLCNSTLSRRDRMSWMPKPESQLLSLRSQIMNGMCTY